MTRSELIAALRAATGPDRKLDAEIAAFARSLPVMVDAGVPDGPCRLVDPRGLACMTIRSLHAGARRYRPIPADKAAREARKA